MRSGYNSIVKIYSVKEKKRVKQEIKKWESIVIKSLEDELIVQVKKQIRNVDLEKTIITRGYLSLDIKDNFDIDNFKTALNQITNVENFPKSETIKLYRNEVEGIFDLPVVNNGNNKEYLKKLKKVNARKVIKKRNVFKIPANKIKIPHICFRCFQDPRVVHVCIPLNPFL